MSNSATKLTKEDIAREAAKLYLADRIYLSLLGKGQPAKLRQVAKSIEIEGVTPRLVRSVMVESDRFETMDRRWAPSIRYEDTKRPFERVLKDLLVSAGIPVPLDAARAGAWADLRPAGRSLRAVCCPGY